MNHKLLKVAKSAAALALASSMLVAASAEAQDFSPMFKIGFDTGGDELYTAVFTDGSTDTIKANGGFFIGGGISIINDAKNIETELSLSYKSSSISAANGDVTWKRFPVDALVFYRVPNFRVGGGLTYHLSPKLSASGAAGNGEVTTDNAVGLLLQADYGFDDKVFLGLRYTAIEYKPANCPACTAAKGNGIGLVLSMSM